MSICLLGEGEGLWILPCQMAESGFGAHSFMKNFFVCPSFLRLVPAALASLLLGACATQPVGTAPEPEEFRLEKGQLQRRFASHRQIGVVDLYGSRIREESATGQTRGRQYRSTGGAVLVKNYTPPIYAKGQEILVTPDHAEVRGRGIVKKDGRLYVGESESAKIIIEAGMVRTEGPVSLRRIGAEMTPDAVATVQPQAEPTLAALVPPQLAQPEVAASTPELELPVRSRPAVKKAAPKRPAASTVSAPTPAPEPVAKKAPIPPQPAPAAKPQPAPAPKPAEKPAPAVDRDRVLKMMRTPDE